MDDEKYSVFEASNDIKLVPSKLVNVKEEDCSLSENELLRYNQSLNNDEDADMSWPKCSIIKILDYTGTYEKRRRMSSELSSDISVSHGATNRVIRRKRKRKYISSDTPENKCHNSRISEEKFQFSNESTTTDLQQSCSCASPKTYNRLIKIVERLEIKIDRLQATIEGNVERLKPSEPLTHYNLNVFQPLLPHFPLYTNEAVDDLEEKLMDIEFRGILVSELRKLGGKRVTDVVNKQMSFLMDYSLGCTYSYYGTKEKRSFSVLKLCNVISDVVRLFFPNTTNEELKEPIQTWLRHCKEKCQKKQKLL